MRVLVTGGREFKDRALVFAALDHQNALQRITTLIHGAAPGADTLAKEWAEERGVHQDVYPVLREEWAKVGPRAGPIRNTRMLLIGKPELVIAFPGGRGTKDMVTKAQKAKVKIVEIVRRL